MIGGLFLLGTMGACARPASETRHLDAPAGSALLRTLPREPRFSLHNGQLLVEVVLASSAKELDQVELDAIEAELMCKSSLARCAPLVDLLASSGGWPWAVEFVAFVAPAPAGSVDIVGFKLQQSSTDADGCGPGQATREFKGSILSVAPVPRDIAFLKIQRQAELLAGKHWISPLVALECKLEMGTLSPLALESELRAIHARLPGVATWLGLAVAASGTVAATANQLGPLEAADLREDSLMPCWEGHAEIDMLGTALRAWEKSEDGDETALESMRRLGLHRLAQVHEKRLEYIRRK